MASNSDFIPLGKAIAIIVAVVGSVALIIAGIFFFVLRERRPDQLGPAQEAYLLIWNQLAPEHGYSAEFDIDMTMELTMYADDEAFFNATLIDGNIRMITDGELTKIALDYMANFLSLVETFDLDYLLPMIGIDDLTDILDTLNVLDMMAALYMLDALRESDIFDMTDRQDLYDVFHALDVYDVFFMLEMLDIYRLQVAFEYYSETIRNRVIYSRMFVADVEFDYYLDMFYIFPRIELQDHDYEWEDMVAVETEVEDGVTTFTIKFDTQILTNIGFMDALIDLALGEYYFEYIDMEVVEFAEFIVTIQVNENNEPIEMRENALFRYAIYAIEEDLYMGVRVVSHVIFNHLGEGVVINGDDDDDDYGDFEITE